VGFRLVRYPPTGAAKLLILGFDLAARFVGSAGGVSWSFSTTSATRDDVLFLPKAKSNNARTIIEPTTAAEVATSIRKNATIGALNIINYPQLTRYSDVIRPATSQIRTFELAIV